MTARRALPALVGVVALGLGGLWLLQGAGLVHVRPILCFADCAAIQGRSTTWAVIGIVTAAIGAAALAFALRRG